MTSRTARHTLILSFLFFFTGQILEGSGLTFVRDPEKMVWLSNFVNNEKKISHGTVVLENDIDMQNVSSSFNPIGFRGGSKTFSGTFDGNGHVISNLNLTYDRNQYVGLFGYSFGMTLKNLVLDESCTITSNRIASRYPTFLGGFVGYCVSKEDGCVLKNLVTMATLSVRGYNYVGGIVGFIKSESSWRSCDVINCMNFGAIKVNDVVNGGVFGGIAGIVISEKKSIFVQNCLNYCNVVSHYSFNSLHSVGGIVGDITDNSIIQNCVNMGDFVGDQNQNIGSVVGTNEANLYVKIENCYWLKGTYSDKAVGRNTGRITEDFVKESTSFSRDFFLNSPVMVNWQHKDKVTDALNSFPNSEFEKWMLLDLNGGRITRMDNYFPRIPFFLKKCNLFKLKKEGYAFRGWYSDPELKTKFNPANDDPSNVDALYAKWVLPIKVTFIFNTEKVEKSIKSDEAIEYPHVEVNRGCKAEWCTRGKKVCNPVTSDKDIELFFIQTPKEYILSFNTSKGKQVGSRAIPFGEMIGELPVPENEGCVFFGWFTDPELKYPFYAERMSDSDTVIHAKWGCFAQSNDKAIMDNEQDCFNVSDIKKLINNGFVKSGTVNSKKCASNSLSIGSRAIPKEPKKEGHVFRGWYSDPEFRTPFNPKTDNISDIETLCAKWVVLIKVTFIFDSKKVEKTLPNDESIVYPNAEVSPGNKAEWCTEGKKVCNPVTSDKDIELFFTQTPKEYILSFNTRGGEQIESKVIVFNDPIGELPAPVKEGCEFLGWFADPELKYPFYAEKMLNKDITVHAKWKCSQENDNVAAIISLGCLNISDFEEWVIMGFDEKRLPKTRNISPSPQLLGTGKH